MKAGLLILASLTAFILAAQTQLGTAVRIKVVNSLTGAPIVGANVVFASEDNDTAWGRTDTEGFFSGQAHRPGSHLLTVTRKGYRMTGEGLGKIVELRPGAQTEAVVEMQPLGVVAGRVLDQFGDPVRHAIVHTEDKISAPGQDEFYEGFAAAITDDRGEYRVAEVEPGKHYVAVEYNSESDQRDSGRRARFNWPQTGGLVLYPDATDIQQARPVEVAAGATTRLNDVHLKIERAVSISGKIKPPPMSRSHLSLQRTLNVALHTSPTIQSCAPEADGSFKLTALPGRYVLQAIDQKTGKVSKPLTLDIGQKDVSGLELDLTLGYELHGRVTVDGPERLDFSTLSLNFSGSSVKLNGDGTFDTHFSGTKEFYVLQGLADDWYIKDVQVAGNRITGRWFEVAPGVSDMMLTLSARGASVSIDLEGKSSALAAMVALLPERGEVPDVESILAAQADESGRFTIHSVPPGSYRLFTLNPSNWPLLMRPDVLLEKHRMMAPLISVAEREHKTLTIPVLKIQEE